MLAAIGNVEYWLSISMIKLLATLTIRNTHNKLDIRLLNYEYLVWDDQTRHPRFMRKIFKCEFICIHEATDTKLWVFMYYTYAYLAYLGLVLVLAITEC